MSGFNKQRNLHTRLFLGGHGTSGCLYPPSRILSLYRVFNWFSYIYRPDGLSNTLLSKMLRFEDVSHCENGGQNSNIKNRRGGEESCFLGIACGSTGSHVLSLTSSSMGMVSVSCTSCEKGGMDT